MEVESFSFAATAQVLAAVKLYASDLYGVMLWRLDELPAQQVMKCWYTTIKDVWGITRATRTANVKWLACGQSSFEEDLLVRWVKYYQSMISSASPEVATQARITASDVRTTTSSNKKKISDLDLDP